MSKSAVLSQAKDTLYSDVIPNFSNSSATSAISSASPMDEVMVVVSSSSTSNSPGTSEMGEGYTGDAGEMDEAMMVKTTTTNIDSCNLFIQ